MAVFVPLGLAAAASTLASDRYDPVHQALDKINIRTRHAVRFQYGVQWSLGGAGDCTTYALHNYLAVEQAGLKPVIWSVVDELGEGHAVVAVGDQVLDNRFWHVQTRADLLRLGYRFRQPLDLTQTWDRHWTTPDNTRRLAANRARTKRP